LTDAVPEPKERRTVWFDRVAHHHAPVYQRDAMQAGARIEGPAIIEQYDSTTVVPPQATAEVDRFLNILIRFLG
jgi:N-methylhydantoinase A